MDERENLNNKPNRRRPTVHTLKSDAEDLLQKEKVSFLDIVSKERDRQIIGKDSLITRREEKRISPWIIIILVLVLLIGGIFAWFYVKNYNQPTQGSAPSIPQSIITTNETSVIRVRKGDFTGLLNAINNFKQERLLSGQLRYIPVQITDLKEAPFFADAASFIELAGFKAPDDFLKSMSGKWNLLMLYTKGSADPIYLFETISPERSLAGLIAWEKDMPNDLRYFLKSQPPGGIVSFKDSVINNIDVRMFEISSDPDNVLAHAIFAGKLVVITASRTALERMMDFLLVGPINL